MNLATIDTPPLPATADTEGTRRLFDGEERVFYEGYWVKTYPVPADSLEAKRRLIVALTRRLFNHTEHGINIPGTLLAQAREHYEAESDPARRRVKAAMLAGALFNRATDIFTKLVDLQSVGIDIQSDNPLMRECGRCLLEAMELGRFVLHRSGEEGIDELWGEPFRAFSVPVEDFYETRYIKIAQSMRDIDRIREAIEGTIARLPAFNGIAALFEAYAAVAKIKTETLRTDGGNFDIWSRFVTAAEQVGNFSPAMTACEDDSSLSVCHQLSDGQRLIRIARDLVFHIARARTPMPKSTRELIERCESYVKTGCLPYLPSPLPA